VIDTPGHVDFTIEVERALRVLDGAVLLICGCAGIQAQTFTVTKQMNRYNLPRLCFINKLDRNGANPFKIVEQIKNKLNLNPILMQIPLGLEDHHKGVVDLVTEQLYIFNGDGLEYDIHDLNNITNNYSSNITITEQQKADVKKYRNMMFEQLANLDEKVEEYFLNEEFPPVDVIKKSIRKLVIDLKIIPVFCGSAYKNKGVQPVLDAICE